MKSFKIDIFKGHPIIEENENIILIDTGAPSTIHISNKLTFLSETYVTSFNYLGLTVDKLSEMLGKEISTLMGTDILSNFKILFDYKNRVIEFSSKETDINGTEISIESFMGIPIIELMIDNNKLKFFLDTGAKLSYLSESLTQDYKSIGTEEDFYPGVGKFETECYEIMTTFGQDNFKVKYGNLPALLQMMLILGGTDGIIGYDFFNNFKVMMNLKSNLLEYSKSVHCTRQ